MSPQKTLKTFWIAVGLCALGGAAWTASKPAKAEPASDSAASAAMQHLLLTDDRVVVGTIEKRADTYVVRRSGGEIVYPAHRVAFLGDSMGDVYSFKARMIPRHDLGEHFKLSKWCLAKGLNEQAKAELEQILSIEPDNSEARQRLASLERRDQPVDASAADAAKPMRAPPPDPAMVIDAFVRGHGQDSFEKYRELERILLNRCSNSGCHSPRYDGDFRLHRRSVAQADDPRYIGLNVQWATQDQKLTALNLTSVRSAIDLHDPSKSPLLYMAINAHGGRQVPPLGGVNDPMYRQLRDWVDGVATSWAVDKSIARSDNGGERGQGFGSVRERDEARKMYQRPGMPSPGDDVERPGFGAVADDAPEPGRTFNNRKATRIDPPGKINDPFDPSMFNQGAAPTADSDATFGSTKAVSSTPGEGAATPAKSDRPGVPSTIKLPIGRKGEMFEGAAPPFNLRSAN